MRLSIYSLAVLIATLLPSPSWASDFVETQQTEQDSARHVSMQGPERFSPQHPANRPMVEAALDLKRCIETLLNDDATASSRTACRAERVAYAAFVPADLAPLELDIFDFRVRQAVAARDAE